MFSEIKSCVSLEVEDAFIESFLAYRYHVCEPVCGCRGVCVSKQKYTHTNNTKAHGMYEKHISHSVFFFFLISASAASNSGGAKNVGQCFYGMGNCKQQLFTLHLLCSCVALMTFLLQQWQHKELFLQS